MKEDLTNTFFDINKFPATEGMIVLPISMSRIGTAGQDPKTYWKYIKHFYPKVPKSDENSKAGVMFLYGDFLYFHSKEKASELKKKFMNQVSIHSGGFRNLIKGRPHIILEAFSYKVWNQFYAEYPKFIQMLEKLKRIYKKDKQFQKYLKEDFKHLKNSKRKLDEDQINFFLEEHLLLYLIAKGELKLQNDFIRGQEKWVLLAYPGKPPKHYIYMMQQNFFGLKNKKNIYECCEYDLEEKKLYDFSRIDLETYDPS